jgi:hypothetical protein
MNGQAVIRPEDQTNGRHRRPLMGILDHAKEAMLPSSKVGPIKVLRPRQLAERER